MTRKAKQAGKRIKGWKLLHLHKVHWRKGQVIGIEATTPFLITPVTGREIKAKGKIPKDAWKIEQGAVHFYKTKWAARVLGRTLVRLPVSCSVKDLVAVGGYGDIATKRLRLDFGPEFTKAVRVGVSRIQKHNRPEMTGNSQNK